MMKNGIYFILIAFLVAKFFKISFYANDMTFDVTRLTENYVKSQNLEIFTKYLKPSLSFGFWMPDYYISTLQI